jgi:hypothetical protein
LDSFLVVLLAVNLVESWVEMMAGERVELMEIL